MSPRTEIQNAIDIARMDERLERIEGDMASIKKDLQELTSASARVKGGIFVVFIIGGIIGWLTTLGSTIVKVWPFH